MLGEYRLGDTQIPDGFSIYSQQKLKAGIGLKEAREALAESCLRQAEWNRAFLGSLKDGTLELKPEDIEAFLKQHEINVYGLKDEDMQNVTICGLDKEVVMAASPDERGYLKDALFKGIYFLAIPLSFSENNLLANAIENQLLEFLGFNSGMREIDTEYSGEKFTRALCFNTTIRKIRFSGKNFPSYASVLDGLTFNKSVTSISIAGNLHIPRLATFLKNNNTIQELEIEIDDDQDEFELNWAIARNKSLKR